MIIVVKVVVMQIVGVIHVIVLAVSSWDLALLTVSLVIVVAVPAVSTVLSSLESAVCLLFDLLFLFL